MNEVANVSGATVIPEWQKQQTANIDACLPAGREEGRTYKHHWIWAWDGVIGDWPDRIKCTVCGEVRNHGV